MRAFSVLLFSAFLARPGLVLAQDSGQPSGVAPQGPIAYGQGGVLYTGPEGTFIVVPDQAGVVRSYSLSGAVESAVRAQSSPGPAAGSGQQPQDQAAQNMEQQAGSQPNQLICECHCPPCPGTAAAEGIQESPTAPGQVAQDDQPAEQQQGAAVED
ncbi:MAG TPA: hypothetical protein VJB59_12695 [Bdellovibrionota bacterium]|nr:hypothetical protein [Bdellovibrionota bacterium]